MTNIPLHPALVHIPIGISVLGPLLALTILSLVYTGKLARSAFWIGAVAQLVAAVGAWVAKAEGEEDEERVEDRVPEALIEKHEELADVFTWTSTAAVVPAVAAAVVSGPIGTGAAVVWAGFTLADLGLAVAVGKAGGEIAYGAGVATGAAGGEGGEVGEGGENDAEEAREHGAMGGGVPIGGVSAPSFEAGEPAEAAERGEAGERGEAAEHGPSGEGREAREHDDD